MILSHTTVCFAETFKHIHICRRMCPVRMNSYKPDNFLTCGFCQCQNGCACTKQETRLHSSYKKLREDFKPSPHPHLHSWNINSLVKSIRSRYIFLSSDINIASSRDVAPIPSTPPPPSTPPLLVPCTQKLVARSSDWVFFLLPTGVSKLFHSYLLHPTKKNVWSAALNAYDRYLPCLSSLCLSPPNFSSTNSGWNEQPCSPRQWTSPSWQSVLYTSVDVLQSRYRSPSRLARFSHFFVQRAASSGQLMQACLLH